MAQATQAYRRSFSGSVGAGMKSVFGGGGRTYYMLVHKVSSKYHKAGESQPIIVDEIEIGRGSQCQVRFDDSFTTVSRRHAAIVRDGDKWKLVQLSTTNSTYLNGHHVHKEWYLQNGDEIQLSTNGPKLGFIIPEGEKGKVSSIGLTARLNLFRQQALRPYKTALTILSCVLLLAIGAIVWQQVKLSESEKDFIAYKKEMKTKVELLKDSMNILKQRYDTIQLQYDEMVDAKSSMQRQISGLQRRVKELTGLTSNELKPYEKYVYYVEVAYTDVSFEGVTRRIAPPTPDNPRGIGWSGTGFLLDDGTFVTARHVARAWDFWLTGKGLDTTMYQMKVKEELGGSINVHFVAVSSSGDIFEFNSSQCNYNSNKDKLTELGVYLADLGETDYAYFNAHKGSGFGGLKFDSPKSKNLEKNTKLTIIGFPFGYGVEVRWGDIKVDPPVASATVEKNGLTDGAILANGSSSETGNSGGPVFYMDKTGKLQVVGIVSGKMGHTTSVITPIGMFK